MGFDMNKLQEIKRDNLMQKSFQDSRIESAFNIYNSQILSYIDSETFEELLQSILEGLMRNNQSDYDGEDYKFNYYHKYKMRLMDDNHVYLHLYTFVQNHGNYLITLSFDELVVPNQEAYSKVVKFFYKNISRYMREIDDRVFEKFKDLGLKAIPCDKEELNHQNGVEIYELFNGYIFV